LRVFAPRNCRDNVVVIRQGGRVIEPSPLPVIPLTAADLPDILELDTSAFGWDVAQSFLDELIVPMLELHRFVGARDPAAGNELVAQGCIFSKQLTFPGGSVHPVAAVSWVAVKAGWRRRGLLRGVMTAQLHGLHDDGAEPIAILTASEAALYGRYGYGQAINRCQLTAAHGSAFRPGVSTEPVREVRAERAHSIVPPLYSRIARTRPGYLARSEVIWKQRFSDNELFRKEASKKRWAIHQDGFAAYRITPGWNDRGPNFALQVDEICAATPVAFASLWRFLLDLDLTREISYEQGWLDDPLSALLLDPRAVSRTVRDHVWLRIVDLDRVIGLRGYGAEANVVVEITDSFCPWNAGTWMLELSETEGKAVPTNAAAEVTVDVRDLGACFFGGTPLARLVTAGLVAGDPSALREFGAALATPAAPWCPEGF
jgi:predicted acetyltransferase